MKGKIHIVLAVAILIPALFGNLWVIGVTGFIVETAIEPLADKFLNSIGPD